MFSLIKKDTLILTRSRSDLTELLLMPFILIAILGLALGNLSLSEFNINAFPVALVQGQSIDRELEDWEEVLENRGVPEDMIPLLTSQAEAMAPGIQLSTLLNDDEVAEWIQVVDYASREQALEALDEGEVSGVISIPDGFNASVWDAVMFEEDETGVISLEVLNFDNVTTDIIRSVLSSYANQFNLEASIAVATNGDADAAEPAEESYGEITTLNAADPISSFQYYTIGMGVMFALHTAPALASRAFKEKKQHVFGRLMISRMNPLTFLGSKMISGTIITFLQLGILFGLSTLIFGTLRGYPLRFWIDLGMLSLAYSLVVGAITSLLTSITLYSNSNASSGFFGGILVTLFAFVGGSFTPVEQFSEALRSIGNWTPNGAMMTAYLQLMQGFEMSEIIPLVTRVAGMTAVLLVVSVGLFPKRRLD
ncbi:ABC transporter permease [Alkalibacterium thalassium]|uniref:ABC-2 type transport system permease protein n=1 Tax=Alkalibacterium thalassium TaxID=426701 RepID=A0A1G9AFV1_9LACT|nr:ABC transporter permease [Alkalibacterium thalassium]SDK25410.1 ABC-2 type transport system permease protein [Alkalibacterium thalassium]